MKGKWSDARQFYDPAISDKSPRRSNRPMLFAGERYSALA